MKQIFAEYLSGRGDRAIADGLNRDGVPCPSARRPEQNHGIELWLPEAGGPVDLEDPAHPALMLLLGSQSAA
ncbi:recombinase family protein [Saccharopolyspora dendranthemae]|uniref:Uncharacterized protein n=1 Tax=Saccharopolyspora dendranthemae TaxID=1181886 RepID=A0A561V7T8_9PSEU|nr:recombinase family protein [Saccharopolyspora dendranthemae]TWG07660.1 hypothetical protein FHU35_11277 [Saccharopolyspora dendranthemae]